MGRKRTASAKAPSPPKPPVEFPWRLRDRYPRSVFGVAAVWMGFWGALGIQSLIEADLPAALFASVIAAVVTPGARSAARAWRDQRSYGRELRAFQEKELVRQAARDRAERMSPQVRKRWLRLNEACALADEFAERGWIEPSSIDEVDVAVARLGDVLEADERTDRLGGEPSTAARRELADLLALVVALCDEAVEHQHEKNRDGHVVPAQLKDARDRLRAMTSARRELRGQGRG